MREMSGGEFVHAVAVQARIEIEAHDDGVVIGRDINPQLSQDDEVVFEVVPDLEHGGILEQRLQLRQRDVR